MRNSIVVTPRSYFSVGFIYIWWQILALITLSCTTQADENLAFFRATEDKIAYTKNPSKYEKVVLPPQSGLGEVYVERLPSLRIKIKEVKSIVIEKEEVHTDLQKTIDELSGRKAKEKERGGKLITNYVYKATLYLTEEGAKMLRNLAKKHNRELFDLRFQTQRLSLVKILGPFGGNVFSTYLEENNVDRLREMFSPIKDKLTWK